MHYPDFNAFAHLSKGVHFVPVFRRLIGDSLTPVSAFHKLDQGSSACLFESVIGGEKVGRYSFLAVAPYLELSASGNEVTVTTAPDTSQARTDKFESADPLEELKRRVEA